MNCPAICATWNTLWMVRDVFAEVASQAEQAHRPPGCQADDQGGHLATRAGWWPRPANCRTGRPRDTWGERGALSWSTRSPPFCATPQSTMAVSLSVMMDSSYCLLDIALRREFADLFESHHIAWRYHMWGLNNYWGKKQIAKVLVLGGTFGRSGPPCFVKPCTLWVRRPFLWLTQTVLLLILYNKQQILDIRDIPTIGRIIPIL